MAEILNIKTEHADMDYARFGRGKKTFVIIPGLSIKSVIGSARAVEKAYSVFGDDYTVYLIDRKNDMQEGYTVFDMADDAAEVMKALGLKDVYLFGTSQGGMIAQIIAIRHPELVKKLVLGSSASRIFPSADELIHRWIKLAKERKLTELCEDFVDKLFSKPFAEKYGALIVKMNSNASDEEVNRFLILSNSCHDYDIRDDLKKIHCPVLVIGAEGDRVLTGEASVETASILGCELYMYPGEYSHAVYDEAADYKERLITFFNEG